MGWNGNGGGSTPVKPKVTPKKPSPIRGLVAGVLVVILVAVAYFAFFRGSEKPQPVEKEKKPTKIKETKPAKASPPKPVKPEKPKGPQPDENGIIDPGPPPNFRGSVITNDNGLVYYSPDPGFAERYRIVRQQVAKMPFHTRAENEIATVFFAKPGATILETAFPPNLEQDFLKHLNDPIEDLPDDSEENRQAKQFMRELKPQLKAAMDRGEKLADLLTDYRREMCKAQALKETLSEELMKIKRTATSEDDVKDALDAANQMLDKYGIEHFPTKITPGLKARIQINLENQNSQQGEQE